MQYLLTLYADESGWTQMTPEQQQQGVAAYGAYTEALKSAGVHVSSNRLRPSATATTLRTANGKTQVLDGPYAESKEQLGGYYLIDVPDLDAAMTWAGRCPGVQHGIVEVRAIWGM
ncbi:MAG: YciI family protein [Terracidiphilus sp.]